MSDLQNLAKEVLAEDTVITTEQQTSVVSRAKEQAQKEGRDPAIAPEFQYL